MFIVNIVVVVVFSCVTSFLLAHWAQLRYDMVYPWTYVTSVCVCMSACVSVSFELFRMNEIQRHID